MGSFWFLFLPESVGIFHYYTYCVIPNWRILMLLPGSLQICLYNSIVFSVFGFSRQPSSFGCIPLIRFAGTKHCSVSSSPVVAGFGLAVLSTCVLDVQHDVD